MARILADKEIRSLIGTVLLNADEDFLNPNGIELRLGEHVLFHSTGEEKKLKTGQFLKVSPGENAVISSFEEIDFTSAAVNAVCPGCMLMGLITPTTTMMREGISQVTTKIDAGFRGTLNWGLRNSSVRDLLLQYQEPIFKLTIFALESGELPELSYGQRSKDDYQDTKGIKRSSRRIPVDIGKSQIVASSLSKLDPKKQLREAGYPFDYIGLELTTLHGKFEVVSTDVRLLTEKIENETKALSSKIEDSNKSILERVEMLLNRKFLYIGGLVIGALSIMYGAVTYLKGTLLGAPGVAVLGILAGIVIFLIARYLSKQQT
ncbi:MAG: hypothetical protein AB1512_32085 [Thermodesulfobacteriota bacterium]